jgi:hypothetical protein
MEVIAVPYFVWQTSRKRIYTRGTNRIFHLRLHMYSVGRLPIQGISFGPWIGNKNGANMTGAWLVK